MSEVFFFLNLLFFKTAPKPRNRPTKMTRQGLWFCMISAADFPSRWRAWNAGAVVLQSEPCAKLQSLCRSASGAALLLMQCSRRGNFLHLPSFPPSLTLLSLSLSVSSHSLSPLKETGGCVAGCRRAEEKLDAAALRVQ